MLQLGTPRNGVSSLGCNLYAKDIKADIFTPLVTQITESLSLYLQTISYIAFLTLVCKFIQLSFLMLLNSLNRSSLIICTFNFLLIILLVSTHLKKGEV